MLDPTPEPATAVDSQDLAEIWWTVRTSVHRVEYTLASRLAQEGIDGTGMPEALAVLAAAPDRRMTMAELATAVGLTTGGVTRLVDRLAQLRLVARDYSAADRRVVYAQLTDAGRAEQVRSADVYAAALRERFAGLSSDQVESLGEICRRLARPFPGATGRAEGHLANGPRRRGLTAR